MSTGNLSVIEAFGHREIELLKKLRARFLSGAFQGAYWQSEEELRLYDLSFAERIRWKWRAALGTLQVLGWCPSEGGLVDWGVGTGAATDEFLRAFGPVENAQVHDHSPLALEFARRELQARHPNTRFNAGEDLRDKTVLVSHVLNELTGNQLKVFLVRLKEARAVLWVESGTSDMGKKLPGVRDALVLESGFQVVAPCTHQLACPIRSPHWCHFFAGAPIEAHQSRFWSIFSRELAIDLRSLPFSYFVVERTLVETQPAGFSRVLGRPRRGKAFHKVLNCSQTGLEELQLGKREAPELFKKFKKEVPSGPYKWERNGDKITGLNHDD